MGAKKFSTKQFVELALLVAVIVLLAFTPIGYIRTFGLEITLIVVPVTVGAVTLGPAAGAVLGAVFGITSFIQCFGMSPFGAVLLGINPAAGICHVAFRGLSNMQSLRKAAVVAANLIGPLLNTFFFMGLLVLFFYPTEYIQEIAQSLGASNAFAFVAAFVGVNGVVEAIVCFIAGSAVSKALQAALKE